jgi:hypothetical protein
MRARSYPMSQAIEQRIRTASKRGSRVARPEGDGAAEKDEEAILSEIERDEQSLQTIARLFVIHFIYYYCYYLLYYYIILLLLLLFFVIII